MISICLGLVIWYRTKQLYSDLFSNYISSTRHDMTCGYIVNISKRQCFLTIGIKDHTYWYCIFFVSFCEIVLLEHGYWKQHHLNHHLFWIFQLMIMDYRQLLMITVDKKLHKRYCTRWYSMFWLFWSSFWHDSILVLDTFVVNDDVCRKL